MTLTAMTAAPPVNSEDRIPLSQRFGSNGIVAALLVIVMSSMIVVTVWSTVQLLPNGLWSGYWAFTPKTYISPEQNEWVGFDVLQISVNSR